MVTKPLPPENTILTNFTVTPSAIVMAVNDTLTLHPVGLNVDGDTLPMDTENPVIWKALDPDIVSVNANGQLIAHQTTGNYVNITGTWQHGGVTQTTTINISVTATRYPIESFVLIPRDSARLSRPSQIVNGTYIQVNALDANGDSVATPQVTFAAHDTLGTPIFLGPGGLFIYYDNGRYSFSTYVAPITIGKFWIVAYSMVYGRAIRDSLLVTGLYPPDAGISISTDPTLGVLTASQQDQTVFVQPCGFVIFENATTTRLDIIFNDSTKTRRCTPADSTGNIHGLVADGNFSQYRKFVDVGKYTWTVRDSRTGATIPRLTGIIEVKVP